MRRGIGCLESMDEPLRTAVLALALAALLLGGGATLVALWGDRGDYAHVISVRDAAEYQAPQLLAKAWSLPVARLYRSGHRVPPQRDAGVDPACR